MRAALLLAAAAMALGGCAIGPRKAEISKLPVFTAPSPVQKQLSKLPPPSAPVAVAVYAFSDQTGQFKPSDLGQTLSRAVTQGSSSMLVKSLQDAGARRWFTVVEREQLKNLLQERQIIRDMRERYLGEKSTNAGALPALLFAGVLLEGGVIGYDTNTVTGGAGAGFLGISASTQYRQDTVTVYLRAVSVKTGEVLTSVTTSKTIASFQVGANAFKYVGFKELLQAEAGFTTNEPDQLALQQAIEKAVYGLVLEGVDLGLWTFADRDAGWPFLHRYRQERDGLYSAEDMQAARLAPQPAAAPKRQASTPAKAITSSSAKRETVMASRGPG
ncbi:CsgG/HfaB family protein [Phenylobacterium sp.]|jgi:curli production assembly/transport component CsgG|uniref:CsgG/HfaB family protein n=1 Tax=Phenylobacterium sp. TaxID=1871053 RepID=UPI002F9278F9